MKQGKTIKSYLKVFSLILIFAFLFFNTILDQPIMVLGTGNLAELWYQNHIVIGFIAIFYIIKLHKFHFVDILCAILFGALMSVNSGINPVITPITVFCYYAACCILRKYTSEDKIMPSNTKDYVKSIGIAFAVGFIPALLNIVEYYIKNGYTLPYFHFSKIITGGMEALQPGISEEIVFRFFLYAFVVNAFKGKIPKTKTATIMMYFLMIVPHCIMHGEFTATAFAHNPTQTILYLIYMCVIYGVPTTWLMTHKNIHSAMTAHWLYDFLRFTFTR